MPIRLTQIKITSREECVRTDEEREEPRGVCSKSRFRVCGERRAVGKNIGREDVGCPNEIARVIVCDSLYR